MNSLDLIPIVVTLLVIAVLPFAIWFGIRRAAAQERAEQGRK